MASKDLRYASNTFTIWDSVGDSTEGSASTKRVNAIEASEIGPHANVDDGAAVVLEVLPTGDFEVVVGLGALRCVSERAKRKIPTPRAVAALATSTTRNPCERVKAMPRRYNQSQQGASHYRGDTISRSVHFTET